MKPLFSIIPVILMSTCTFANEIQNEAVFNMMSSMMKQTLAQDMESVSQCLGVSSSELQSSIDKTLDDCYATHKVADSGQFPELMGACIEQNMTKNTGISQEKAEACSPENEMENTGPNQENLEEALGMISEASENTLLLITLPVYENSQVLMHSIDGMEMGGDNKTIPGATFASPDSLESILKFYQAELPNYKLLNMDGNEYLLMEEAPDNFDIIRDFKLYAQTPHVFIQHMKDTSPAFIPDDSKALIEIAYLPKP